MKSRTVLVSGIVDNMRRVFQVLAEISRKIEHETGLTPAQLLVVKMLQETSPMKVSDLAKAMCVHPATMVGLLDRLEAKGLVRRSRSAEDRRVVHLSLTQEGKGLVQKSPEVTAEQLLKRLESLTTQQLAQLSGGMEHLVEILGIQKIAPQLIMSSEVNVPARIRKSSR